MLRQFLTGISSTIGIGGSCSHLRIPSAVITVVPRLSFFSRSDNLDLIKPSDVSSELVNSDNSGDLVTGRGPLPLITKRELQYLPPGRAPRQAWVENLDTVEEKKLGMVDLHPDVFATFPRIELIHSNLRWQQLYKTVNWAWTPTKSECYGSNRKPWPQKGLGKARHGSRKSPLWIKGAKAKGPRGPKSHYYMLPFYKRVNGLCSMLSVKLAQDDLKIVDSLELPTTDPKFLEELASERNWGISILFVDDTDIISKNIALATDAVGHINIMPVYGLNVASMLKHETLVLTLAAVNKIEEKLLFHLNRNDTRPPTARKIPAASFH